MRITVLNRQDAKNYIPEGSAIIIRMEDNYPMKPVSGKYYKEAKLYFHDVSCDSEWAITQEDAEKIAYFVKTFSKNIDEIVVHCVHGQGRSPAVAKVISEYFNIPFFKNYPNLNKCVYSKLKEFLN